MLDAVDGKRDLVIHKLPQLLKRESHGKKQLKISISLPDTFPSGTGACLSG
jgi:hypothetical protein